MGSYKWAHMSPNIGYKNGEPTHNPTWNQGAVSPLSSSKKSESCTSLSWTFGSQERLCPARGRLSQDLAHHGGIFQWQKMYSKFNSSQLTPPWH